MISNKFLFENVEHLIENNDIIVWFLLVSGQAASIRFPLDWVKFLVQQSLRMFGIDECLILFDATFVQEL